MSEINQCDATQSLLFCVLLYFVKTFWLLFIVKAFCTTYTLFKKKLLLLRTYQNNNKESYAYY